MSDDPKWTLQFADGSQITVSDLAALDKVEFSWMDVVSVTETRLMTRGEVLERFPDAHLPGEDEAE